jgi:hypothetical protein
MPLLILVAGALILSGCASAPGESSPPEASSPPVASSQPESPAASAASACAALTEPASLAFNAPIDFEEGAITAQERDAQLESARAEFAEIEAPPGAIADALSEMLEYLEQAPVAADGAPFDPKSDDYANIEARIAAACNAEGEELVIAGHGG